jgi:hypothetical protein
MKSAYRAIHDAAKFGSFRSSDLNGSTSVGRLSENRIHGGLERAGSMVDSYRDTASGPTLALRIIENVILRTL